MSSMETDKTNSKNLLVLDVAESICKMTKCSATTIGEEAKNYISDKLNTLWDVAFSKGAESEKIRNDSFRIADFDADAVEQGEMVRTRSGLPVRILCYNAKGNKPIVAIVENDNEDMVVRYTINGRVDDFPDNTPRQDDLVIVRAKFEGWTLINEGQPLFTSEDVAMKNRRNGQIVAHIEW